jgi:hypothetical protein
MKRLLSAILVGVGVLVLGGTDAKAAGSTTNPPSNLVVTTVSGQCKQLRLTWNDNSSVETDFHVERAPDISGVPGTFAEIATVLGGSGSTKTYLDTSVSDDTTYWYRVRWHNHTTLQFSAYSNQASGNSGIVCAPTALTVTALLSACDKLNLSWTDNSKVEDDYHIERTAAAGTCASAFTEVGTRLGNGSATGSLTYQDTNLVGGVQYCYRIRAHKHSNNKFSAYSTCVCQTVTACNATK